MFHRQSGSAGTINVYFFLVVLVLFIASLMASYALFTETSDMERRLAELRTEEVLLDEKWLLDQHYVEDVAEVVGLPGTYQGREGVDYGGHALESAVNPADLDARLEQFSQVVGVPTMGSVRGLFDVLEGAYNGLQKQVADAQRGQSEAEAMQAAAEQALADAQRHHGQAQRSLGGVVSDHTQKLTSHLAEKDSTIGNLQAALQDRNQELNDEKVARADDVRRITEEKNELKGYNTATVEKLRIPPAHSGPDGRVVRADARLDRAWVDLGRKDSLVAGTVFRITDPGSDMVKAHGVVSRVEQERAEIAIRAVVDGRNPVTRGDRIHNALYTPNSPHNIYLMGRFGYPYDQEAITTQLEGLGNEVLDSFAPGVDLVIVGKSVINETGDGFVPVENTQEYKQALSLGVQFIELSDVRDLLHVDAVAND